MIVNITGWKTMILKKRRATTNRSPNPNLKNYQNEKINLNVNRFICLYGNEAKGYPNYAKKLQEFLSINHCGIMII
jgi:hypothetical protein